MAAGAITAPRRSARSQMWASRTSHPTTGNTGPSRGPQGCGTPEIYFPKTIDNSRLVKQADTRRNREMTHFACALAILFVLVMVYAWQHFSAVEYGYRIEQMKAQRDAMVESNRELRLEEASLRDPERIDALARQMGLETPHVGQVVRIEPSEKDLGGPVLARATDVAVISAP